MTIPVLLFVSQTARPTTTPAPSPVRVITACTAMTRAEVEQALNRAVDKGTEEAGRTHSTCDYTGKNGLATITIHRLRAELDIASEMESLKSALPGAKMRETPTIGTRAFFVELGDSGAQLHVIQGSRYYVLVSLLGFGTAADVSATAEAIARTVLDRL